MILLNFNEIIRYQEQIQKPTGRLLTRLVGRIAIGTGLHVMEGWLSKQRHLNRYGKGTRQCSPQYFRGEQTMRFLDVL